MAGAAATSLCQLQALRQAMFRVAGRPSNSNPHPNSVLLDTAQNLFSKGIKNLSSVKHVLQGRVCLCHLGLKFASMFRAQIGK